MALSEIDRNLLERCLQRKPRAWEDFVDRFMGLVVHVVNHTARARSVRLTPADRDDLCAEVFLATIKNDFALLRNFRGKSSLATYLTVVARRIVVKELLSRMSAARLGDGASAACRPRRPRPASLRSRSGLAIRRRCSGCWAACKAPRPRWCGCIHLEGRSYQEISSAVGMPENSIGPILSRARNKMRRAGVDSVAN